jgi:hypothetical protein
MILKNAIARVLETAKILVGSGCALEKCNVLPERKINLLVALIMYCGCEIVPFAYGKMAVYLV